jgi:hypothetical protein
LYTPSAPWLTDVFLACTEDERRCDQQQRRPATDSTVLCAAGYF